MKTLLALSALALLSLIALLVLKRLGLLSAEGSGGTWPFYVKRLLSQPEQVLYHRLVRALPEHIVLAQVQVSRVLGVRKGWRFIEWNNRINRLRFDFVVCTRDSGVIAAIELDDGTHQMKAGTATDQKKNKASGDAGLKLVRWHVSSIPDENAIRRDVLGADQTQTFTARVGEAHGASRPPDADRID